MINSVPNSHGVNTIERICFKILTNLYPGSNSDSQPQLYVWKAVSEPDFSKSFPVSLNPFVLLPALSSSSNGFFVPRADFITRYRQQSEPVPMPR